MRHRSLDTLRRIYWQLRYAFWSRRATSARRRNGYAVLVPVPGDLPLLLELALDAVSLQHAEHRVETVVVPDVASAEIAAIVQRRAVDWNGRLRLSTLAWPEQFVLPRLNDPGKNHAAQLLRGSATTEASHVVFHDADLFPLSQTLHEDTFAAATVDGVMAAGVEGPWDRWFDGRGKTIVATWEMCARVGWLMSFRPWRHFAHEAVEGPNRHVFDTTFFAQWHTPPGGIQLLPFVDRFVHFNYVISTFRNFSRSAEPFHDSNFRLVLLRVLVDTLNPTMPATGLPTMTELEAGLRSTTGPVYYLPADAPNLLALRVKLERLFDSDWVRDQDRTIASRLAPFTRWADECTTGRQHSA